MKFTVVGGSGFIGGALVRHLRAAGHEVAAPPRDALLRLRDAGHVVYAAGITADFRGRPFDTLRAHTTVLAGILEHGEFDSLLYLSSARLYRHAANGREDAAIAVRSDDPEDLYDITKLAGEALCHACGRNDVRIARLSNVVGPDFGSRNFLVELIRDACTLGNVELRSAPASAKDYVLLEDVVGLLPAIAIAGRDRCYNVASGCNLRHDQMLAPILAATGARLTVRADARLIESPAISIDRVAREFGFAPSAILPRLEGLIHEYRKTAHAQD